MICGPHCCQDTGVDFKKKIVSGLLNNILYTFLQTEILLQCEYAMQYTITMGRDVLNFSKIVNGLVHIFEIGSHPKQDFSADCLDSSKYIEI